MNLKNKYERVIIRNNMSLGLSSCAYEYLLNLEQENNYLNQTHDYDLQTIDRVKGNSAKVLRENNCLKEQLKQRDEAIDETIKMLNYGGIDSFIDSIENIHNFRDKVVHILQKYKGDNK